MPCTALTVILTSPNFLNSSETAAEHKELNQYVIINIILYSTGTMWTFVYKETGFCGLTDSNIQCSRHFIGNLPISGQFLEKSDVQYWTLSSLDHLGNIVFSMLKISRGLQIF